MYFCIVHVDVLLLTECICYCLAGVKVASDVDLFVNFLVVGLLCVCVLSLFGYLLNGYTHLQGRYGSGHSTFGFGSVAIYITSIVIRIA